MMISEPHQPIGIFDSGVGGLSVFREIRKVLPRESLVYVADQANVPYGRRSEEEILGLSLGITRYLLGRGAKLIVVACNTASAAALYPLRKRYPDIPFVGMEPAVKPAAEHTESGIVGVLATPTTFQGEPYASVVERFANGVRILQDSCPGLVQQIEDGDLDGFMTRKILADALLPMLEEGIDRVVLGCTHYPFVISQIRSIIGAEIGIIDPAPAVARQARSVLEGMNLLCEGECKSGVEFLTSGDPRQLADRLPVLIGQQAEVRKVVWQDEQLTDPVTP